MQTLTLTDKDLARYWAKVEKSEGCWLWTAATVPSGYGIFHHRDNHCAQAHRVSFEMANGAIPEHMQVDHMCHNRRCVNPDHMRLVTIKQNGENRMGAAANSTSGVRGVSFRKDRNTWRAKVYHNGRQYQKTCSTIAEAEAAVIAMRNELFTHNILDRTSV
ncbi:HNH endonuclease [Arthrobacter phage Bauer]|uniref:HNH endonuclease n=1 Tax=Arthrobacter phage Bauer TaxID=2985648 RepID=A0A9E7V2T1_9CAUD|nr:HNH endonuclease [Arthrobacter phage Bauer]UYM26639.1 HNH endonuclease [Arthrobacter phage Bauer]